MLNSHDAIYCGPQVKFFADFFGAYISDPLERYRFFRTCRDTGVDSRDLLKILGTAYVNVLERAVVAHGKRRWADKNPDNAIYLRHWQILLGDSFFFVLAIRNPLDAVASLIASKFSHSVPPGLDGAARFYLRYLRQARAFVETNPLRSHVVRYEDLVREPRRRAEAVFESLGEEVSSFKVDDVFQKYHGLGVEDSKISRTRSVKQDRISVWQRVLTSRQQRRVLNITRAECEWLGYRYFRARSGRLALDYQA